MRRLWVALLERGARAESKRATRAEGFSLLEISKPLGVTGARPRTVPAAQARPWIARRAATCLLGLVLGLGVSWQVLGEPGVVGLVHDWSIAPFAEQHLALLQQNFDGWFLWGLGEQVAYPFEYPLRLAFGLAAAFGIGGAALSKAVVLLVPATAFVAAAYLARVCGLTYGAAWVCGAFYALDPVMLNKLVSGQTTYLIGYALLPLVPALYGRACEWENASVGGLAVGGILAMVAMQVQLGVLAVMLLVLVAVFMTTIPLARRAVVGLTAAALLAAIEAPTVAWLGHGVGDVVRLDQFGHGAAWLETNSLHPADAVRLIGYLAEYDVLSVGSWMGVWQPASWAVIGIAALGLVTLRGPMRPALALAAAVAIVFACGTTTAVGPAITWIFEHFRSAQMFRELYHVMAIASLAFAIGAGAAFGLAGRLPRGMAVGARVAFLGALAIYVAPMLSGDVSGWLAAVPVDRYLATAFRDENTGDGRVVWFPMDQPLAYDNRGSGVDPMAVTDRGSLWLYSLTWPLSAVDAAARSGDIPLLRSELRALGVASAVTRDRFHSRYRGLPAVADVTERFFDRDLRFDSRLGTVRDEGPGVHAYRVPAPLPALRVASRFAVVPRRMSVVAGVTLGGAAAFGFAQKQPDGVPYDVYVDRGDRTWEALQYAGLTRAMIEPNIDPFSGFAGGDLWWWYRPQYADARRFSLVIGRGNVSVPALGSLRDGRLTIAWIATPAGGDVVVRCGGAAARFATGGAWGAWRSAAVRCGALAAGSIATVSAVDADAEVALRGVALVDANAFDAATAALERFIGRADHVVVFGDGARGPARFVRAGRSASLGTLAPGTPGIVEVQRPAGPAAAGAVRIESADGDLVAWGRFAPDARVLAMPFVAGRTAMRLRTAEHVAGWRLESRDRDDPAALVPVRAAATPGLLLAYDQGFDAGWQVDGAVAHFPSALGTNVFVMAAPRSQPAAPRFAYARDFHVAYFLGAMALSLGLAFVLALMLGVEGRGRALAGSEPAAR